jgi:hypothetical protein
VQIESLAVVQVSEDVQDATDEQGRQAVPLGER